MPRKLILSFVISGCVLAILIVGCKPTDRDTKNFTEAEVAQVQAILKDVKPETYRIILPEIKDGKVVGSKTYGSLPVTEVRRVASQRNIEFSETGNVQAVFMSQSASAGGDGSGAGSHTPSQTPGTDIGSRIEKILERLDKSQYTLIY